MLSRRTIDFCCKLTKTSFHQTCSFSREFENPIYRTIRILYEEFKYKTSSGDDDYQKWLHREFPSHVDVVIIGGGAVGSSIAYWLKQKSGRSGLDVVVVEKDPTYRNCCTALSSGALHQQFLLSENIQMSLFGADFLRNFGKHVGPEANVNYNPGGYLALANEEDAALLQDSHNLQRELGVMNVLLGKEELKKRFPWMNVSDIELGCLGLEKEGWFNPIEVLMGIQKSVTELGAQYITAEAVDFEFKEMEDIYIDGVEKGNYQGLESLVVKLPGGETRTITFSLCIIAAGAESVKIAQMAKIGTGPGMLQVNLPIEKMRRYLYGFNVKQNPPGLNTPMVSDYSGAYFRRDGLGGAFIAGISMPEEKVKEQPSDLQVGLNYFDKFLRPILEQRVPAFGDIEVKGAWSGVYDYNRFDYTGILGPHPYYNNLYLATGFSGNGIQQAPAIGRGIAELIIDGRFLTIDLTRFGFDRFLLDKPVYEILPY